MRLLGAVGSVAWVATSLLGCKGSAAAPSRSGTIAVGSGTLHFEDQGRGPAVVLIHGGNLDHRMWDELADTLARAHRVIRFDVRGFGQSTMGRDSFRSHDDVAVLLDSLKVERAAIVGLSLGGRIGLDFALGYPARVSRLVLSGPGMSGWPDWSGGDTLWQAKVAAAIKAGDRAGIAAAWLESDYMRPAMEHPELKARLTALATDNVPSWLADNLEIPADPPAFGRLGSIAVPVLVLIGDRDSPPILRIVDSIAAGVNGARVVRFPGAGHMLNLEEPAKFNQLVTSFLDER